MGAGGYSGGIHYVPQIVGCWDLAENRIPNKKPFPNDPTMVIHESDSPSEIWIITKFDIVKFSPSTYILHELQLPH